MGLQTCVTMMDMELAVTLQMTNRVLVMLLSVSVVSSSCPHLFKARLS
jgi:hypothetical protein